LNWAKLPSCFQKQSGNGKNCPRPLANQKKNQRWFAALREHGTCKFSFVKTKPKLFVRSPDERDTKTVQIFVGSNQPLVLFPEVRWSRRRRIPVDWRN
jgi:hypothetical protein